MTTPTIREAWDRHMAAARRYLPGGVPTKADRACMIKATARDAGVTVAEAEARGMDRVADFIAGFDAPLADQIRAEAAALRAKGGAK